MASCQSLFPTNSSISLFQTITCFLYFIIQSSAAQNSNLFREYIGAEFKNVTFTDVPINPKTRFDFILSFAIDYATSTPTPTSTNGKFIIYWDSDNLTPKSISSIKSQHPNVRVSLSVGGDSVSSKPVYFQPTSINSWVSNAFTSLKIIIQQYHLDGIDIDYEHFNATTADPSTFAECIGRLITRLKTNGLIRYASIAPYDDPEVQANYLELWKKYGHVIDYVNFQFYAYDDSTSVDQFIQYYKTQKKQYKGGKILPSFVTEGSGGLAPGKGFFDACKKLKRMRELYGIFVWSADSSKALGFRYEKRAQDLLVSLQSYPPALLHKPSLNVAGLSTKPS